jgi:hypothetical protein
MKTAVSITACVLTVVVGGCGRVADQNALGSGGAGGAPAGSGGVQQARGGASGSTLGGTGGTVVDGGAGGYAGKACTNGCECGWCHYCNNGRCEQSPPGVCDFSGDTCPVYFPPDGNCNSPPAGTEMPCRGTGQYASGVICPCTGGTCVDGCCHLPDGGIADFNSPACQPPYPGQ